MFFDDAAFQSYEVDLWRSFFGSHERGTLAFFDRPEWSPPGGRSQICLKSPVQDALTGSYADVERTLGVIKHELIDKLRLRLLLVAGDQQSYSRMLHLQYARGRSYAWLLPLPGEFHFICHALMAIHHPNSGWYKTLIYWVITKNAHGPGFCPDSIAGEWDSVEKYNTYCNFYEALILGIVAYLALVIPSHLLYYPETLIELAIESKAEGTPPPCLAIAV